MGSNRAGKELPMKKALVMVLAAALALSMLAIAGCGEEDKAREYMQKGDELSEEVTLFTTDTLKDAGALLATLGLEYASTGTVEAQTLTDEGKAQIESLIEAAEAAKAEYAKILELDDVEKYKEYATLRIKALNGTIEVLESLTGLLDELANAEEGTPVSQVVTEWGKASTAVLVTAVEIYTANRDAQNIQKEIEAEE